jgi:two-component system chemotaxis response regulator CheB
VDVLFHSAARSFGVRVVGVVLSGTQSDGTLGLRAIKRRGGAAVVQADAAHSGMPTSAMRHVDVDAAVPLQEIARTLTMMVGTREEVSTVGDEDEIEESPLEAGFDIGRLNEAPGDPTVFRCPECGGALWELDDGGAQAYVCHVGHSFSDESMVAQQRDHVERALWSALRLLEERAALNERLAERVGAQGLAKSRASFESAARRATEEADVIRGILQTPDGGPEDELAEGEAA